MQSSPPENRAKNIVTQATSSQRVSATVSRTNSHDSTTKTGRIQKVGTSRSRTLDFQFFLLFKG